MVKPYLNLYFKFHDFCQWNNEDMKIKVWVFVFPNLNQFS